MGFDGLVETLDKTVRLEFKKSKGGSGKPMVIDTFTSYQFDSNILTPAAAFRFTAPSVDKEVRVQVRSGDLVSVYAINQSGVSVPVSTGIVDETDTHVIPTTIEYVLTGRDMLGQLVDNAAVDAQSKIINTTKVTLSTVLKTVISNTRIPAAFLTQQVPNGTFLYQTNPGETKITALQRCLDLANCLVWCKPNGQVVIGKPNFTTSSLGSFTISSSDPRQNNVLEGRVKRATNLAIRQMVSQLSTMGQVDANAYTKQNADKDMRDLRGTLVGRSVYRVFNYGNGEDAANTVEVVGNQNGDPRTIGHEYTAREIARENMKVIDVEVVVRGHVNAQGQAYMIDQVYDVFIEDDDVQEPMLVYACRYDMTLERGPLTTMRLCRLNTICAYGKAI